MSDLSDLFKQIPWQLKAVWLLSGLVSLAGTAFVVWAIARLVLRYT